MLLCSMCNSCSNSTKLKRVQKELDSLTVIVQNVPSKNVLLLQMELEGLKASKRTLYDWNSIVRTAVRPDDRMNEYDQMIQKLEKKIIESR